VSALLFCHSYDVFESHENQVQNPLVTNTRLSSSTVSKYFHVGVAALALAAGSFHNAT